VIAVRQKRPVVGRKNYQRPFFERVFLQGGHDLAHAPVQLLDHVTIQTAARPAAELVGSEDRHVRHHVRHIQKERLVLVLLDERHRPLGESPREL
jgi:hypothetical protein